MEGCLASIDGSGGVERIGSDPGVGGVAVGEAWIACRADRRLSHSAAPPPAARERGSFLGGKTRN